MDLKRIGVFAFLDGLNGPQTVALARKVERLGYSALWIVEALGRDLRLVEAVRKGLGLLQRDLKMLFCGFPLTGCCSGGTRDRLREAGDRPKR